MGRVEGKVAIVTGAASGIGASAARALAREGARIVIADVVTAMGEEVAASCGANARYMHHDVASKASWQKVVAETEHLFGPVSVLVNNAGIIRYGMIEVHTEEDFRRVIEVNQIGVFLGMKSVIGSMRRASGGSIVNISSAAGLVGAANAVAYTASKFAVRGMTKVAAIELAADGIRVNSVHPGMIYTPMAQMDVSAESEAVSNKMLADTPAGRWGSPDEIANMVLMLASDESSFATGAEFVVDGGLTCG